MPSKKPAVPSEAVPSEEAVAAEPVFTTQEIRDFAGLHSAFMREMARAAQDSAAILEAVRQHLDRDPLELPVVSRKFPAFDIANIHIALNAIGEANGGFEVKGVAGIGRMYRGFTELTADRDYALGPVDYISVPISASEELTCVSAGLLFFTYGKDSTPLTVWLRVEDPDDRDSSATLEVVTVSTQLAEEFLTELEAIMLERNVYRGKVLSLEPHVFSPGIGPLRFHTPKTVNRDDVVMPDGVLELIERQVSGIASQRELLVSKGQHLKRGVLMYGPPGTGKTHIINYLLHQLPDFTVVVVSGQGVERISAVVAMARKLHPALVIVEDVDLIAEDRSVVGGAHPLLLQLLNELDGIGSDVDLAFILTTNRVDVLERALAARPGRVDLAVEVPLPDRKGRRRLFKLYAAGLGLDPAALDRFADRADGVTASFAKEAARRAVLIAGEAGRSEVEEADFSQALDELLSQKDELTRRLLGSKMAGEYASDEAGPGGYA